MSVNTSKTPIVSCSVCQMAIHITRGKAIFFQSAARPTYVNANSTKAPYNQPLTLPDEFIPQTPNNSNSVHQCEWFHRRQHPTLLINPPPAKGTTDNAKKELNQTDNDSKTETRHFCESESVNVVKVVVCGGFIFPCDCAIAICNIDAAD